MAERDCNADSFRNRIEDKLRNGLLPLCHSVTQEAMNLAQGREPLGGPALLGHCEAGGRLPLC
jgi:hypothetical protein